MAKLPRGPHAIEPEFEFYLVEMAGIMRRASDVLTALQSNRIGLYANAPVIYSRLAEMHMTARRIFQGRALTEHNKEMVLHQRASLHSALDLATAKLAKPEPTPAPEVAS